MAIVTEQTIDIDSTVYQFGKAKKANKIADTKYNDVLIGGSKADTFTISHGNATIMTEKGNDKINVTKDAYGTLTIQSKYGGGNDILNIDALSYVDAFIEPLDTTLLKSGEAEITFDISGQDLLYKINYKKGGSELNLKKDTVETLTVKNFFTNNRWMNDMQFV